VFLGSSFLFFSLFDSHVSLFFCFLRVCVVLGYRRYL